VRVYIDIGRSHVWTGKLRQHASELLVVCDGPVLESWPPSSRPKALEPTQGPRSVCWQLSTWWAVCGALRDSLRVDEFRGLACGKAIRAIGGDEQKSSAQALLALNGPHNGRLRRMKEGPEGRGSLHAHGVAYAWEPLGDDEAMH
jgi:hypothetical protein